MTISKRRIALLLTLTMVFCLALFVGVASATEYSGQTAPDDYTISTASQMSQLASAVNAGTTYEGSTFKLTQDITLNSPWTPIGTAANPFSGDFSGGNYTISDLNITDPGSNYQGLFGYVKRGLIANLKVNGAITSSIDREYIGGVVGYTDSSLANCHSSVNITIKNADGTYSEARHIGGIAGSVENHGLKTVKVQYCSNSGNIYAGRRVGGIVGAVYATFDGNVRVDQCYNTGNINVKYTSKVHSGGIVGYCQGYITNCYNTGEVKSWNLGHYIGGVVGVLQGASPQGAIANCYNKGYVDKDDTMPGYAQALFATVDRSTIIPTENCFWHNDFPVDQDLGSGWGTQSNVSGLSAAAMQTAASTTYLNHTSTIIPDNPGYYYNDDAVPTQNKGYPILKWQRDGVGLITFDNDIMKRGDNAPRTGSDAAGAVYLDGTASSNGNGTLTSPYNNFASAKAAVESAGGNAYICVIGKVTISGDDSWSLAVNNVKRSVNYDGYLVEVASGGNLTLGSITIDGNKTDNPYADSSLILVNGGTVTMGSGTYLQNNRANTGGAVRVNSGTFTMNDGIITGNTTVTNSGGVMVKGGSFIMNGGTISSNTTPGNGGGVGIYADAAFTLTGGTISGNTATSDNGSGVYVKSDSSTEYGTFTLSPSSSGTLNLADRIYLCSNTKILVSATLINLDDPITIQCASPSANLVVAQGSGGYTINNDDADYVGYYGGGYNVIAGSNTLYLQ